MTDPSTEPRKLRVGVIGSGAFAEAGHVPGLQSHPLAEVVALCGHRTKRTRTLAQRFNIPSIHTDYRELCARDDIDAVTIVTLNTEHAVQAVAALGLGKHVFCEKPLAVTVEDARKMVRAADASDKVHQLGFTYRYLYGVRELRRRLEEGDIGAPYYLRAQYDSWQGMRRDFEAEFRDKRYEAGGMLYDVGSHLFDLARFVLGPIAKVSGFTKLIPRRCLDRQLGEPVAVETDDIAGAWFVYRNGVHGQWFASRATPSSVHKAYLEVVGEEGALRASLSRGADDVLSISRPSQPAWQELPLPKQAYDGKPHCLPLMMRSFVEACRRGQLDDEVDASFHDGLAAQLGLAAVTKAGKHLI